MKIVVADMYSHSLRLPVHMSSTQQKMRKSMVKEALETLHSVHEKECEMYRSNPSIHPDISAEYRLFSDKKTQSILALGGDPTQYNMAHDWHSFWKKRMEEIFIESWILKRKQCLALLDANQKPPSPQPSSWTHRSPSPGSLFFSSLSSMRTADQKRSSKKRKIWVTEERERSKKRNENQDGRSSPTNYPRDRQVKRNIVINDRHDERSPKYYARPELLSRKEDDYMETRITDMLRVARQKEWDEELMEKPLSNLQKTAKGSNEGWEQKSLGKHSPDPLEIAQDRETDQESRERHQQSPPHKLLGHNESWQHYLDAIGDPFPMLDHFNEPHTVIESGKSECKDQHRAKPHGDMSHGTFEDQSLNIFSKKYMTVSSVSPESTKKEIPWMEDSHKDHKADQDSSKSITQIFRNFAVNKLDSVETITHSHEGEVSSTTASPSIKIDVVNVLEVLTYLGDKLGALYDPLKLVLVRTKELQSNGADPMTITNDQDTKLLLQMIQEKLQGILKDGKLSIIKKVIIEEAEQRLSLLLELQEQRNLTGNLNLTQLAHHCLNMDTTSTVDFIRKVLQCQGHTHLSEKQLMKLYMAVKAEQLKVVGDHHNSREAATLPDNAHHQSHNLKAPLGLKMSGDSVGLLCGSTLSLSQAESHTYRSNYDFSTRKGRLPCNDAAQTTCLQAEMSSYPKDTEIGSIHNSSNRSDTIKPSKAYPPGQSSTLENWSPQSHVSEPYPKASTSIPSGPPEGIFRDANYHQKASKYVYKKPICITLPKHQPQKSIIGAFNPLRDCDTDSEEYE
ncbi:hypothetical protein E2C01_042004 [Portunus trituberculatus]|uniref:Uncharacterized protein n=1 Tax=Portunus trituberculatus TaxID=210409 RepID=A0A5B7FRV3_PORTR|nr:hypothetical protein [Portunus trituberculatus]